MAGIPEQNGLVSLMVFVWDVSLTAEPVSRAVLMGLSGRSSVFLYTTPTSPTPAPAEFLPNNLATFTVGGFWDQSIPPWAWGGVPEPASATLTGLGIGMVTLLRRRRSYIDRSIPICTQRQDHGCFRQSWRNLSIASAASWRAYSLK